MNSMKTFLPFCLSFTVAMAQPYGQTEYSTNSNLTSAKRTIINGVGNDGFVMAGINGTNIHIDKTLSGGAIPGATGSNHFMTDYTVVQNGNCSTINGTPVNPMTGVGITEVVALPNYAYYYAMASVYSEGVFVTFLQQDGVVSGTFTFEFPAPAIVLNRPSIYQDISTGNIYVCGRYDWDMYVIKINQTGSYIWSGFYNASSTGFLEPRDIIFNSNTNEVVIVGHMEPAVIYGTTSDAFFMTLDPANGNVNNFKNYTSTPCNWFNSVKRSYAGINGGSGYVVGGFTDYFFNSGQALMMKLDNAGNIVWNTLITSGASNVFAGQIVDVVERQSTSGQWEYFGLATTTNNNYLPGGQYTDFTVFKLDANGNPAGGNNEYHYASSPAAQFMPCNLSFKNSGGSDIGLHVMATETGVGPYLVESYFNGVTGCLNDDLTTIAATEAGPNMYSMSATKFGTLPPCNKISVSQTPAGATVSQVCTAASVPGGSNARSGGVTGINEEIKTEELLVYPNPGNGNFNLDLPYPGKITVVNLLGEQIFEDNLAAGKHQLHLENCKSGVYIVKISGNDQSRQVQIIKQ